MLTLRSKTPVRFEWSDKLSETTVTLSPDDDSETIQAKLQRILSLEDSQGLPVRQPGAALAAAVLADFPPLFDASALEAELASQGGALGWSTPVDIDTLPEV